MDCRAAALALLDRALADQPDVDGQVFSEAAGHLAALRDGMIAAGVPSRRDLEHVNAVISVVLAGHFPLGAVPWPELAKARVWLAAIAT